MVNDFSNDSCEFGVSFIAQIEEERRINIPNAIQITETYLSVTIIFKLKLT